MKNLWVLGVILPVAWTVAAAWGGLRLYTEGVRPRTRSAVAEVGAESFVSFRDPTEAEFVSCSPFVLQSTADPTVVLTPKAETPSLDSLCGKSVYRLETWGISGKWQVRFSGITLRVPEGTEAAVTVELGEASRRSVFWMTISTTIVLWLMVMVVITGLTLLASAALEARERVRKESGRDQNSHRR